MKKYAGLSKETRHELLSEFCDALCSIKTSDEAVKFLTDLLTSSEAVMLAKRIKIAKLLIGGKSYNTIEESLSVSQGTIAKVAAWLAESGEGFRVIAERAPQTQTKNTLSRYEKSEWSKLKHKYPMMFWPQLLVEEIVEGASRKQKERIRRVVEKLDRKSKIYKDVTRILKSKNSITT